MAWHFCLFRPDRVKALVNTSVPFLARNPAVKGVHMFRTVYGDDFYFCRFQEPGEAEGYLAQVDTARVMKKFLISAFAGPTYITKEKGINTIPDPPSLPSWLTEEDINYYASNFKKTGFTGGLNYYRAFDITWELTAPWTGSPVLVPTKFIMGDQDITLSLPGMEEYVKGEGFKVHHFIQQEKPEEVSKHIYDFIKKF
ncbi:hypothetical protein Tsubulata_021568 [Turnera subulata]|uniref:AB hydrolase-1 domain-containing protein n=1 Tax=Turnera subulata TaxID=218843 RepID=A0A9Q0GGE5_9ROSI|nr:hypothetical protein Tsubulata_021568 [Turnera subulata]